MSHGASPPLIGKNELFARLAEGRDGRATVVTPNQRLAAALAREYDEAQAASGKTVWEAADILPFSACIERLYQDALYSEIAALPLLLSPAQELALWEEAIRGSERGRDLLAVPQAASGARDAWRLAHSWRLLARLESFPLGEDARAFSEWAWRYQGWTARDRHTDRARLADVVAGLLAERALRKPAQLVAYGFDIVTPQEREFFDALAAQGVEVRAARPDSLESRACRIAFPSAKDEIAASARWARSRLEANPRARIGVVVPDLARHRRTIQRLFAQVCDAQSALPGAGERVLPFNVSLGEPLAGRALVHDALLILELAAGEPVEFARASRIIRSPFIAGGETEFAARARLDAKLRARASPQIMLSRLAGWIESGRAPGQPGTPILRESLAALGKYARDHLAGAKAPPEWARHVTALLQAMGFPGERTLDSAEFQTRGKWHEMLADFAALERVRSRMSYGEALARLRRMAADTLFQPEAPEVPIQILGVLESAGLQFDSLWVMGLTEEAWPMAANPNPFLPMPLQRAAGVPESSASLSLELDRRITQGWLGCAAELVLSHPLREGDRDLAASPLIGTLAEGDWESLRVPEYPSLRDAIHAARAEERISDARAPALAAGAPARGGAAIFKDQAACPFRAFALHRLDAEPLAAPQPGLDAMERGTLMHRVLAAVWRVLQDKAKLDAATEEELLRIIERAVDEAMARVRAARPDALAGRFAAVERARLVGLARGWLEHERGRGEFSVAAIEDKRSLAAGPLAIEARLDRVDRLPGGERIVIDYKSGAPGASAWLGERPDEPQLPLYLVSAEPSAAAVAFAQVKAGEMRFTALARDAGLLPGTKAFAESRQRRAHATWDDLVRFWRVQIEGLAAGFAGGEAAVDPKRYSDTCRHCVLQPLCRVYERLESLADAEPGDER